RFHCPTVSVLDGGLTVRVADRGPGIADKLRAVEPGYSSAGEAERRIIAGVGAGLAIAARQAEERGGRLEISDNLGGGTVVTLEFARAGGGLGQGLAKTEPSGRRRSNPDPDRPSELS